MSDKNKTTCWKCYVRGWLNVDDSLFRDSSDLSQACVDDARLSRSRSVQVRMWEIWCRILHTSPRPPLSSGWAALQLHSNTATSKLKRHRQTSDSSGSTLPHSMIGFTLSQKRIACTIGSETSTTTRHRNANTTAARWRRRVSVIC